VNGTLARLADRFDAIDLREADARARLAVRTDRKYIVDAARFATLVELLERDHVAVEVDERRVCTYESVYFDTPDLLSFRQHVQGRRRRFKCRTRLYGDGACFFEVKLRSGRGETVKRRIEIPRSAHGRLVPAAHSFLDAELRTAYGYAAPAALAPRITTSFTRLTLVARDASERLTCDIELAFRSDTNVAAIVDGRVLVETKTPLGNGIADRHLRRLGARPVAPCSKYCLGVALAGAPRDNAFRPLLRRHFVASSAAEAADLALAEAP